MQPQPLPNIAHVAYVPPFSLSQADVTRLLSEPLPAARIEVLHKVAESYNSSNFGAKELKVAEHIFRLLLKDTEVEVRKALAESIQNSRQIPRDILLSLTRDVEQIALPLIRASEALTDADLLQIVRSSSDVARLAAVAERPSVSQKVSLALVETHHAEVVGALLSNQGADIPDQSYHQIMADFPEDEKIIGHLSNRPDLPVTVVEKLITVVSRSLASELRAKYNLSGSQLSRETEQTREIATLKLVDGSQSDEEMIKLTSQLVSLGRLSSSMLLTALCRGNMRFFEVGVAQLSRIPVSNARALINDRGELGFKALYHKAGLPDSMYPAVRLLLHVAREMEEIGIDRPGTVHYANRVVEKILYYTEGKDIENLSYILALVRQNVQH